MQPVSTGPPIDPAIDLVGTGRPFLTLRVFAGTPTVLAMLAVATAWSGLEPLANAGTPRKPAI